MINARADWWPSIDRAIGEGIVRAYPTKKAALEAAKACGWPGLVVKAQRRFEHVWLVGKVDLWPEETAGVVVDVLRMPTQTYETGADGIKRQPVILFRLPRR